MKGDTAIDIANRLLKQYNGHLREIFTANLKELEKIKGVGFTKAIQIKTCFELEKRLFETEIEHQKVTFPQDVDNIMLPELKFEKQEKLYLLLLGSKNYLISKKLSQDSITDIWVLRKGNLAEWEFIRGMFLQGLFQVEVTYKRGDTFYKQTVTRVGYFMHQTMPEVVEPLPFGAVIMAKYMFPNLSLERFEDRGHVIYELESTDKAFVEGVIWDMAHKDYEDGQRGR